jgi:hypothetical protein
MQPDHQQRLARAERNSGDHGGFATLAAALRELGELDPASLPELQALNNTPAQPVRLSYVRDAGTLVLHARAVLGGPGDDGARCATLDVPDWVFDAGAAAPCDEDARLDLVELVQASFAVLEARLAEFFEFTAGSDTMLAVDPGPPATLAIRPATTPSPRLQPALPTPGHEYAQAGDPHQAGGGDRNRGTGGTGIDGTQAADPAAVPSEQVDLAPLGGAPETIEGTLGQALVEGSPTDEDPPAAAPGRLGH